MIGPLPIRQLLAGRFGQMWINIVSTVWTVENTVTRHHRVFSEVTADFIFCHWRAKALSYLWAWRSYVRQWRQTPSAPGGSLLGCQTVSTLSSNRGTAERRGNRSAQTERRCISKQDSLTQSSGKDPAELGKYSMKSVENTAFVVMSRVWSCTNVDLKTEVELTYEHQCCFGLDSATEPELKEASLTEALLCKLSVKLSGYQKMEEARVSHNFHFPVKT